MLVNRFVHVLVYLKEFAIVNYLYLLILVIEMKVYKFLCFFDTYRTCIVISGTPLWRNGPPDKPVLCNACGSRWRTKGSLVNYTPLHARAEPDDFEDRRVSRVKTISIKNKEAKILKRKQNYDNVVGRSASIMLGSGSGGGGVIYDHQTQGFRKVYDEDMSNRSSSGSAISNSDGYMQLGSGDASDLTGSFPIS